MASALVLATACDQSRLDIPKKGVVSEESFYKTDADAESALVAAYYNACRSLCAPNNGGLYAPYLCCFSIPSDEFWGGGANFGDTDYLSKPNEWRADSQNGVFNKMYNASYQGIYYANLVINKFAPTDSPVKAKCIDEARFLRAYFHLILAIGWGNPPIVTEILGADARPGNSQPGEVLAFVESEFKDILPRLSKRNGKDDKEGIYRANQGICQALLAKTQMWMGKYADAQANLKAVIKSGDYDLVPGDQMKYIFHKAGDGSCEKVFELNFKDNPNAINGRNGHFHMQRNQANFWRDLMNLPDVTIQLMGWGGGGNPSQKFVDAIMANEPDSYRRKAWLISYEELLSEFTYSSIEGGADMTPEERLMDGRRGIKEDVNAAGGYYANCGWFAFKHAPYQSDLITNNNAATDNNHVIMRYAEVLLMYAEACAMTNDNDGLQYLNAIQTRAGAPTTSLTMENVKREKWFEMFMEGVRFEDLVRWGDAVKELGDNGKCVPNFQDEYWLSGGTKPHKAVLNLADAYYNGNECGFKAGKNELMPYPFGELNVNPEIKQNPGW